MEEKVDIAIAKFTKWQNNKNWDGYDKDYIPVSLIKKMKKDLLSKFVDCENVLLESGYRGELISHIFFNGKIEKIVYIDGN